MFNLPFLCVVFTTTYYAQTTQQKSKTLTLLPHVLGVNSSIILKQQHLSCSSHLMNFKLLPIDLIDHLLLSLSLSHLIQLWDACTLLATQPEVAFFPNTCSDLQPYPPLFFTLPLPRLLLSQIIKSTHLFNFVMRITCVYFARIVFHYQHILICSPFACELNLARPLKWKNNKPYDKNKQPLIPAVICVINHSVTCLSRVKVESWNVDEKGKVKSTINPNMIDRAIILQSPYSTQTLMGRMKWVSKFSQ